MLHFIVLYWPVSEHLADFRKKKDFYIRQLSAGTGYCLEDLPSVMADKDGCQERFKESVLSARCSAKGIRKILLILNTFSIRI